MTYGPHPKPPKREKQRKPMKRTSRIKPRSDRMKAIYAGDEKHEGRAAFVARILKERPTCEAGAIIGAHVGDTKPIKVLDNLSFPFCEVFVHVWVKCTRRSEDVHEPDKRSHHGSKRKREILTDEKNAVACCRNCHDWVEQHKREAIKLGLMKSRYAGRNP